MRYDFDLFYHRRGTECAKWDKKFAHEYDDMLPMWVADMDFACPPEMIHAIENRLKHPLLGYPVLGARWYESIIQWQRHKYGRTLADSEIGYINNVMGGVACAIQEFTNPEDAVLFLAPGYPAFSVATIQNHRKVAFSLLKQQETGWEIDFKDFEYQIEAHQIKLFVLCSPHNPTGRSWSREELMSIAVICEKHQVLIVSDEIHADLTYTGMHIPIGGLNAQIEQNVITLCAPTKAFNLAGLSTGYAVIPNPELRKRFFARVNASEFIAKNVLGIEAMIAAYTECESWLDALNAYLQGNAVFSCAYLKEHLPLLHAAMPEATYLLWIDFSATGYSHEEILRKCKDEAHLYLSDGRDFISGGEKFMRMNLACPRGQVKEALCRLEKAVGQGGGR